jgi:hypothetical protein
LRGWTIRPLSPNGDWVLLFHGVSDNRSGVLGQAELVGKSRIDECAPDRFCVLL